MKYFLLFLASIISFSIQAQWETIQGNGNQKSETRQVGSFSGLSVSGSMNVQLKFGKPGGITIVADDNLIPYIETIVENGKLIIRTRKKANLKSKNITVHVSATTLNDVSLSGSGNIKSDGNFEASGKNLISLSGSGNMNLSYASLGDVSLLISGSGNMNIKGKSAKSINAAISGSGNLDAGTIQSNDVTASVSGSGNITVYATNSLDARVSGSGNVVYKGTATKVTSKVMGSGKVIKG